MEQSLIYRLIFWVICLVFVFSIMYIKKFLKFSWQGKIFTIFFLVYILQVVVRTTLLLIHYDLVLGTTKEIHYARKGDFETIAYEFKYKNKTYTSSTFYKKGVKQNGIYYVRVVKNIPFISGIDFWTPVNHSKDTKH